MIPSTLTVIPTLGYLGRIEHVVLGFEPNHWVYHLGSIFLVLVERDASGPRLEIYLGGLIIKGVIKFLEFGHLKI